MASPVQDCFPAVTTLEPPRAVESHGPAGNGPRPAASDALRRLRTRLGLTTRKVAEASQTVAREQGSAKFAISHARLVQIENGRSTPSLQKVFSLSAIYGVAASESLSLYVPAAPLRLHVAMQHSATHLATLEHLHTPGFRYGVIGLDDFTMAPLIRPGSIVQIDPARKIATRTAYRSEHDRPVYFLETRDGFICCWCEVSGGRLLSIPHTLSPGKTRVFAYPSDVDVVGRVTAVTARL
jgi:transcriptional regulator with XRE-family HTH domain